MKINQMNNTLLTSEGAGQVSAAQSKTLSQDDFLKIFTTQIRMQDPTKPFDSSAMLQQMSQLTSMAASNDLKKTVQMFSDNVVQSQMISASELIGKHAVLPVASSVLDKSSGVLKGAVLVPAQSMYSKVEIRDSKNNLVKTLTLPESSEGLLDFEWDGKDEAGNVCTDEFYSMKAVSNIGGTEIKADTAGYFKINSVTMDRQNKSIILNLDGMGGVSMDDVVKFSA